MACIVQKVKYPSVSIITPVYNSASFIAETIRSVQAQTFDSLEMIIVDDGSTDESVAIVQSIAEHDSRIKLIRLDKNSGAAVARNAAIEAATGTYLAFLDSDDLWFPDKLIKQIRFMEKNGYDFTCTSYTKIDEKGKPLNRIIKAKNKSDYNEVLKTCPGNSTVIYNAEKLGKFKVPDIKKRNDYVLWLQVIKKSKYLFGIEEPLVSHRIRKDGLSGSKKSLVGYHWEIYREIERLSLVKSSYLITYWVFKTIFKLR